LFFNVFARHHILQFGPAIQAGNEHLVHHMEVFYCAGSVDLEVPMYDGPCDGADRPEKTQVLTTNINKIKISFNK